MKIAVVHSYYSSKTPSGENIVVAAQVSALEAAGFDVKLISVRTDDLSLSPAYPLLTAKNVISGTGSSPLQELTDFQPDIVHVHNLFPNYSTRWLSQWNGPIVATVHNFRPICASGILFRDSKTCTLCPDFGSHHAVINACYRDSRIASIPLAVRNRGGVTRDKLLARADRIILLSERSRNLYRNAGLDLDKVRIIPNFVDGAEFSPHSPLGNSWVYVGRLTNEKGIDSLLKYWPAHETLRIFGDGPLLPAPGENSRSNVFFEGKVERDKIPAVLEASKGLIFPSLCAEGAIPLTYVEALAAGRPVVAFSGNGAADDIEMSGSGETFTDWSDLPTAIGRVESRHQEYAQQAYSRYGERFTTPRWIEGISRLYSEVLESR